ncbi:hypothetical protein GGX14DRAFT_441500 [Mycena pura]|uniref:Uncharacterized protein n=1 Tax=Mycena pura TaxID=153505 RepID=A0AAD6YF69_9AGAR|nr:hypothetical protein GGX14DRAFT_441500 [Mycena pura]
MQGSGVGQGSSVGRRRVAQSKTSPLQAAARGRRRRRWASKPSLRTLSGACSVGVGRYRAAGIKNEPTHTQRSVRGRCKAAPWGVAGRRCRKRGGGGAGRQNRACARSTGRARAAQGGGRRCRASARGVTGWRPSRTSPRTLNRACAGGTRQRCGALQAGGGTGRERRQKYGEQKVYEKLALNQQEQEHRQRHTKLRVPGHWPMCCPAEAQELREDLDACPARVKVKIQRRKTLYR